MFSRKEGYPLRGTTGDNDGDNDDNNDDFDNDEDMMIILMM